MKVLISLGRNFYATFPELGEWLRRDGIEVVEQVDLDYAPPKERIKKLVSDVDIYIVGVDEVNREIMDAAPNLKLIIKHGAGYNNIDLDYAAERGISVTFARGANSESVAELAIGLMFAVSRCIPQCDLLIRERRWTMKMGCELFGKTLGLVGYGNIGSRVARIAKSMDMKVLAFDPFMPNERLKEQNVEPASIEEVFEQSDFISLHAPATEENYNLVNAALLSRMKSSAYLINTARGELIDEEALADVLRNGRIGGAALDVFKTEPPSGALVGIDNVVYTAHIGACTVDSAKNLALASYENVKRFINGQPLENQLV